MTRDGYKKHKAVIEAWANGAKLEYKRSPQGRWAPLEDVDPYFEERFDFRIKPTPTEYWAVVDSSGSVYGLYNSKERAEEFHKFNRDLRVVHLKESVDD